MKLLGDPLGLAALVALIVVAVIGVADIAADGKLDPAVLALVVAVAAPLTPALISRATGSSKPPSAGDKEE